MITAATSTFFDPGAVIGPAQKAERKVLDRAGAFVRQTAKTSIRPRKAVSEPGEPPSSHTGAIRQRILFAFDNSTFTEVVGAVLGGPSQGAPAILEFGGEVEPRRRRTRRLVYRARPYMGPALAKEAPNFPTLWQGAVLNE